MVMWGDGARWDAILETLRKEGFSKVDCIRATVEILRLPLAEAKRVVHESRAWVDRLGPDEEWHEGLILELRTFLLHPSVAEDVWARQGANPLGADQAMELAYEELAAFRAQRREEDEA